MALGNGNPKEGDKGSNFFWELKVLQGLEAIAEAIEAGGGGGGGGGITQLTGDVLAGPGAGSVVTTIGNLRVTTAKIANNAVTFAKMQTISGLTFLGNPSAGAAAIQEIPLTTVPYFSGGIGGAASNTTFLRGDGTWSTIPSLSDGDKGDITVSGSGANWTIDNSAVTYAKIQNVSANSFLANVTSGSAVVQEISTSRIPLFTNPIGGVASATTFLRGDGTWAAPPAAPILQNSRTDLTARGFINYEGTLNAVDDGTRINITGPTTNQGLITKYTANNSSPAFEFGMSAMNSSVIPINATVTSGLFNSDRFINLKKNRLIIIKDENAPATGLVLTPTIVGGQLTSVAITNPGTGSYFPPIINGTTYSNFSLQISGGNPTTPATASTFIGSPITDVIITNGGSNYGVGTTATFPAPPVGGTLATGTPIIKNGVIVGVTITNPGAGYIPYGDVTFSGGGGAGATARFSATNGVPYRINITNPGAGYTSDPTITLPSTALMTEAAAVEIRSSQESNTAVNSTMLRVSANSSTTTAEFRNHANAPVVQARPIGGGFSFDSQHNANVGSGLRISNPSAGISIINHSGTGIATSSTFSNQRGLDIVNSATNSTAAIALLQMNGTPSGLTQVQEVLALLRNNNTVNVVAPTVPNNSTDISGVGGSINYYNPVYNVPRPDILVGQYVGSITGSTLTVTSVTSGAVDISQRLTGGTIPANTYIIAQTGGTPNGVGTYTINPPVASPIGPITITGNNDGWGINPASTELTGLWRDAQYQTAQGGFDISLATAIPTNDPRRFNFANRNKVFRLRADGRVTFPQGLPTSAAGLVTGDLYTQTTAELGIAGGGTQKVICIV